jgi:hypothetical protein
MYCPRQVASIGHRRRQIDLPALRALLSPPSGPARATCTSKPQRLRSVQRLPAASQLFSMMRTRSNRGALRGESAGLFASAAGSAAAGSSIANSDPRPIPPLSVQTLPPWSSVRTLTSQSPRPSPPRVRYNLRSAWVNGSKKWGSSSSSPSPGSEMYLFTRLGNAEICREKVSKEAICGKFMATN